MFCLPFERVACGIFQIANIVNKATKHKLTDSKPSTCMLKS